MDFSLKSVFISDDIDQKCIDILERNAVKVVKKTKLAKDDLIVELNKGFDGLIVRSASKVTADVIESCPSLKIIGRAGTGVDNIDCDAATKQGVIVMNTPGGNTMSAAELTCSMIMSLSRNLPQGHESMRAGRWDRKLFMGEEVFGKTLAIIGLGRIGKEVALRMQAFGMKTIGYDPIISAEEAAEFNTAWLPLEKIWPQADYITVHTPLIPQTRNLINLSVLSGCKPGVKLINVARGGIIDEEGIIPAIEKGFCGGAALDVFTEEPPKNKALTQHPKIICTPHLGASTKEAQSRVAEEIAEQFIDLRDGKRLVGAINAHAVTKALSPAAKPWVKCAQVLGAVVAQLLAGKLDANANITVATSGPGLYGASYVPIAVLSGLLKAHSSVNLNLVNTPALARSLGVQTHSTHENSGADKLEITVQNGAALYTVSGHTDGTNSFLTVLNGARFTQPVALAGRLVFLSAASLPEVLKVVATISPKGFSVATGHGDGHTCWMAVSVPESVNTAPFQAVTSQLFDISL